VAFGDTVSIHYLSGNKTIYDAAGSDITNTVLSAAVEVGDSRVILETGVASWTGTDNVYPSIRQASNYFGADFVLGQYLDDKDSGTTLYQKALDICASIARSSTQSLVIAVRSYRSFPLNPDASIYRSIPAASGDTLAG
jgi:hypothetical protein